MIAFFRMYEKPDDNSLTPLIKRKVPGRIGIQRQTWNLKSSTSNRCVHHYVNELQHICNTSRGEGYSCHGNSPYPFDNHVVTVHYVWRLSDKMTSFHMYLFLTAKGNRSQNIPGGYSNELPFQRRGDSHTSSVQSSWFYYKSIKGNFQFRTSRIKKLIFYPHNLSTDNPGRPSK